ncbi:unnamed protein product [Boreogadus saida]
MTGCEWDDEDDTTDGHQQYAYDGEDFLAFDLKTLTWVAPVRQAVPTKLRWDQNRALNQYRKHYYTKECVDWLKKYLAYGKSTLQRTERPRVSLLQRSPSSPVVSVDLDLTAVPQEDWGRYECVVQLKGIEDISTPLDPALIRTNWGKTGRDGGLPGAFAGSVAGALLLVGALVLAGVCWHRKRNGSAKRPAAGSDTSSENPEGQKHLLAPTPDPKS